MLDVGCVLYVAVIVTCQRKIKYFYIDFNVNNIR